MPSWQGSGTLVAVNGNTGLILSCRHVAAKEGNSCTVVWPSTGEKVDGTVIEVVNATGDYQSDLSFIICKAPDGIDPVPIEKFDPVDGPFTCLGYRGEDFYVSVSETAEAQGSQIRLSAPLIGGMSGGGCFNCRGHLVGVGVGSTSTWSIAADGEFLEALVSKYSE